MGSCHAESAPSLSGPEDRFLISLYEKTWENTHARETAVLQWMAPIVAAMTAVGAAIGSNGRGIHLAVFVGQLLLTAGMCLTVIASFEYRRNQRILAKIEAMILPGRIHDIIPAKYHSKSRMAFIESHKVAITTMAILLWLAPFVDCNYSTGEFCLDRFFEALCPSARGCALAGCIPFLVATAGSAATLAVWEERKEALQIIPFGPIRDERGCSLGCVPTNHSGGKNG